MQNDTTPIQFGNPTDTPFGNPDDFQVGARLTVLPSPPLQLVLAPTGWIAMGASSQACGGVHCDCHAGGFSGAVQASWVLSHSLTHTEWRGVCVCVCTQTGFSGSPEMASPVSPPYNAFAPSATTAGTGHATPRPTFMPLASDGAGSPVMASPIGSDDADEFQDADGSDAGGGFPGNGLSTRLSDPSDMHLSEMSGKADDHGHDGDGGHVDGLSPGSWGSFPQVSPTLSQPFLPTSGEGVGNHQHPREGLVRVRNVTQQS